MNETRDTKVETTTSWVCRNELGDRGGDAHTSNTGDEPTPNGRGCTTGVKRVGKGGGDCRKGTRDTGGEGQSSKKAELALEDLEVNVSTQRRIWETALLANGMMALWQTVDRVCLIVSRSKLRIFCD